MEYWNVFSQFGQARSQSHIYLGFSSKKTGFNPVKLISFLPPQIGQSNLKRKK